VVQDDGAWSASPNITQGQRVAFEYSMANHQSPTSDAVRTGGAGGAASVGRARRTWAGWQQSGL
jgi:hypothetical protein